MIRSGLQVVDAQTNLAASLGTTTESVQVLARAGDLAGVSMGGIEQATRRLAQAAQGSGPRQHRLQIGPTEPTTLPQSARRKIGPDGPLSGLTEPIIRAFGLPSSV